MSNIYDDLFMTKLTIWREARGEGVEAMAAVGCVLRNRVKKNKTSYYTETTKKLQFSSITDPKDLQLSNYPRDTDTTFQIAETLASKIIADSSAVPDNTEGATLYYDDSIKDHPPYWATNGKAKPTVKIGRLNFFKEF